MTHTSNILSGCTEKKHEKPLRITGLEARIQARDLLNRRQAF
jgi:hypothetical protein